MHPSMNYVETTIPPGMTLTEWRRARSAQIRRAVKPRTRRRLPLLRRAQ